MNTDVELSYMFLNIIKFGSFITVYQATAHAAASLALKLVGTQKFIISTVLRSDFVGNLPEIVSTSSPIFGHSLTHFPLLNISIGCPIKVSKNKFGYSVALSNPHSIYP